jgi:hypothetical protein
MTGRTVQRRFDRERLIKLFGQLGTDNEHEAAVVRGRIDSLLSRFDRTWHDVVELLGGGIPVPIRAGTISSMCFAARTTPGHAIHDPPRVNPLALVRFLLEEYVALQPHQYVAIPLWALHTHIYDRFMVTPRLALRSPVGDCGKTTLLDILSRLTSRPAKFDSITPAVLVREIDQFHPTMLIDEVDNLNLMLAPNGRLRAIFNSGHRFGGTTAIWEGGVTRKLSTFAPLALALPIMGGGLPRTLNSRSITIAMERSKRKLRHYGIGHPDPALDVAYGQILLWLREVKLNPEPEMPTNLRNRFADNWRPLIAIADSLGWGERAREAMMTFAREYRDADVKILLLIDIRKVFDKLSVDWLPTKTLLTELHPLEGGEWSEFLGIKSDGQPHKLRDTELAFLLRDFKIKKRVIWPPGRRTASTKSANGYRRRFFEDAWDRYCPEDITPSHPSDFKSLEPADDDTL